MVINKNKEVEFTGIANINNKNDALLSHTGFNPRGLEAQYTLRDMRKTFAGINKSLDKTHSSSFQYLNKEKSTFARLKHQKPFMRAAYAPAKVYRDQAYFNPKHSTKLYQIEDVILMQKQSK